jgi:hypothetical protein
MGMAGAAWGILWAAGYLENYSFPEVSGRSGWYVLPLTAATNWRVLFVGIGVWAWAGLRLTGWMYRGMLGRMVEAGVLRRRVRRVGWYAMGVLLVALGLLGLAVVGEALRREQRGWSSSGPHELWIWWGEVLCVMAAWALVARMSGVMAGVLPGGDGGRRVRRSLVMAGVYPLVAGAVAAGLLVVVMWMAGVAGLAAWSMTR